MSPKEVAAIKKISVESVRRILRDEQRRLKVFPHASSIGEGKSKRWDIPAEDVKKWHPKIITHGEG